MAIAALLLAAAATLSIPIAFRFLIDRGFSLPDADPLTQSIEDLNFFETLQTGEVLSRLSSDTTLIQSLIGSSISMGLRNSLLFLGGLLLMIWSSPQLASIIVGLLFLVVLPIIFISLVKHWVRCKQYKAMYARIWKACGMRRQPTLPSRLL